MNLTQPQQVSFAVGNVVDSFTVDATGKATSAGVFNRVKKFQLKYPKSGTSNTASGSMVAPRRNDAIRPAFKPNV